MTTLSEAEVTRVFGAALAALPPPPRHFTLQFRFESDTLTEQSTALIPAILAAVKALAVPEVVVIGHTDTMGDAKSNVALGLKRATTVRGILVGAGLPASTVDIVSHGEGRPARQDPQQRARAAQPPRRDHRQVAPVPSVSARPRRLILLSGIAPVLVTAVLALYRPAVFARLEDAAYDVVLRAAGTTPPHPGVVIVDIDERSLESVGQWPWRRDVIGTLITRLRDAGASVIAIDIMFAEPDRSEMPRSGDARAGDDAGRGTGARGWCCASRPGLRPRLRPRRATQASLPSASGAPGDLAGRRRGDA